jgi:hypothetical protein
MRSFRVILLGHALALWLTALPAASLSAQSTITAVRLDIGQSSIHADDDASGGGVHLIGSLDHLDRLRFEAGMLFGMGYFAGDLGLEARVRFGRLVPFVSGGGGILGEEDYSGPYLRVTGGLAFNVRERLAVRVAYQHGEHRGSRGPNLATIGLEYRTRGAER